MFNLAEIARHLDAPVVGDASTEIRDVGTLDTARENEIAFVADEKQAEKIETCRAAAFLLPNDLTVETPRPVIRVDNPAVAIGQVARLFRPACPPRDAEVSQQAIVSEQAVIAPSATIYPGVFVDDDVSIGDCVTIYPNCTILHGCQIGDGVTIYPGAVLYPNSIIGKDSIIHAGAVVGGFGFGYDSDESGHRLSEQAGYVEIAADVEIGCNTTIDRGTFGATRIGSGTKIDNQVQIAHNCQIGDHNLLCSQVGIAGSSNTGSFVVMAGQVGIGDHINIRDNVTLLAKAGVMQDIEAGQKMVGAPAIPARQAMQMFAIQSRLPEMRTNAKKLARRVEQLESRLDKKLPLDEGSDTRAA